MRTPRASSLRHAGAAACWLALAGSGCSFIFTHNPPPNHRELRYFDCPDSIAAPVVDTGLAVAGTGFLLLAAAFAYSTSPFLGTGPDSNAPLKIGLLAIPMVALPVGAAAYGFTKSGNCGNAKAELVTRINTNAAAEVPP